MRVRTIFLLLVHAHMISAASRASPRNVKIKTPRTPKPVNWNISYYSEPFRLCKTYRNFNPVEQAKIHGIAVALFRKCGPSLIVPYASRYKVPAFALAKIGDYICLICNIFMGYFDAYERRKTVTDDDVDDILTMLKSFCSAMDKGHLSLGVKYKRERFILGPALCHGFIYDLFECTMGEAGYRDGDAAKYAVVHFKKLLL